MSWGPEISAESGGSQFIGIADVSISAPLIRARATSVDSHSAIDSMPAAPGVPGGGGGRMIMRDVVFHESPISSTLLRTLQDECLIVCGGDIVEAEEMAMQEWRKPHGYG